MFGCLRRLGCLAVVLVVAGVAYFARDLWLGRVQGWFGRDAEVSTRAGASAWESLTPERAERGERAVSSLARRNGPVFVTLRPGELASYVFLSLAATLPPSAEKAEAAVVGERVYVRALVPLRDLAGAADLGPLGGMLAERDTLRFGGTFDVVRTGLAQFHVREIQLGAFPVPERMVPAIVRRIRRGALPEGVAADALPVPIPEYIGDVRIARGRITLYRAGR